ncbi:MAG: FixH family protein [Prevotellaceae bacterium]|nr:FixH family protein [Prevotellaceae bacterium]
MKPVYSIFIEGGDSFGYREANGFPYYQHLNLPLTMRTFVRAFVRTFAIFVKKARRLAILMPAAALLAACDKNRNTDADEIPDPTEGLTKVRDFQIGRYTVSAYNETGELRLGYTKLYFAVADASGKFIDSAALSAFPEMDMGMMKHSTPRSEITKVPDKALYETYYAFLMYSGQGNGKWYYDLKLTVGSVTDSISDVEIDVKNVFRPDGKTERRVIQSVSADTSADASGKRYVVTLVEPVAPKVGSNDVSAYIHERKDANTYIPVERFALKLDPRMPSMENHSSPNNADLTWSADEQRYKGTVNFSMTGYWKLNLILQNEHGATLYGNPVSGEVEASSLYFEVEF